MSDTPDLRITRITLTQDHRRRLGGRHDLVSRYVEIEVAGNIIGTWHERPTDPITIDLPALQPGQPDTPTLCQLRSVSSTWDGWTAELRVISGRRT
jgi:hypothetical protein